MIDRVVVREGVAAAAGRVDQAGGAARRRAGAGQPRGEDRGRRERWHDELFSTQYACPNCKISYEELEPRTFSFNSPYGACPACEGLGPRVAFDPELVMPDPQLSLAGGAIAAVERRPRRRPLRKYREPLAPTCWRRPGVSWTTPLAELKPKVLEQLLHGDGKRFPGLLGTAGKGIRHDGQRGEAAAAGGLSRPGASARSATARGCGPRPGRCAWPAGPSTRSRP